MSELTPSNNEMRFQSDPSDRSLICLGIIQEVADLGGGIGFYKMPSMPKWHTDKSLPAPSNLNVAKAGKSGAMMILLVD